MIETAKFHINNLIYKAFVMGKAPEAIANDIFTDILRILQAAVGAYAGVQFALACISYMSKDQNKQNQAKDHAVHVLIGLVGVFVVQGVVTYFESKAKGWG
ncbi:MULTISPECIES: hypothetical protein [Listeria]|uniref:Uncharacterized protein n=1 Tax=Listeria riparia FSL S10-1204 TaxID=1265816 RepID=W7D1A7_9LIST|nr:MULTISPECIES: hypothetical protein [Listeria]EUJ42922.1 hypothetical protein PRIP_14752 [Listeria riparia FSL S10-1204]MBC2164651.1 hypothetical protein [Listeria booriae]